MGAPLPNPEIQALPGSLDYKKPEFDSNAVTFDDFQKTAVEAGKSERGNWHSGALMLERQYEDAGEPQHLVQKLRKGECSSEKRDPHLVLFSLYLQNVPNSNDTFRVNFQEGAEPGKSLRFAENKIGMGEMFPQTVEAVTVQSQNGTTTKGIRTLVPETGREDYCEEKGLKQTPPIYNRIAVFTGDTITINAQLSPTAAKQKWERLRQEYTLHMQSRGQRSALATNVMGGGDIDRRIARQGDHSKNFTGPRVQTSITEETAGYLNDHGIEQQGTRLSRLLQAAQNASQPGHPAYDRFQDDFEGTYSRELVGGRLGCAFVAGTLLKEAGYITEKPISVASVDRLRDSLLQNGWRVGKRGEKPKPGCVIIWEKTPGKVTKNGDGLTNIQPGHKHVGIAIGSPGDQETNAVVDNHFLRKGGPGAQRDSIYGRPIEENIDGKIVITGERRVEAILFPPKEKEKKANENGISKEEVILRNGAFSRNVELTGDRVRQIHAEIYPPPEGFRASPLKSSEVTPAIALKAKEVLSDPRLSKFGDGVAFQTPDGKWYFGMLDPHPPHPPGYPNRINRWHEGITIVGQSGESGAVSGSIPSNQERTNDRGLQAIPDSQTLAEVERNTQRWTPLIQEECKRQFEDDANRRILENIIRAMIQVESKGDPNAIGKNRNPRTKEVRSLDRGLMQLNSQYHNAPDIMDPAVNIHRGVNVVMKLYRKYGWVNMEKIINAYNCGHGDGDIPQSTKVHTAKVLKYFNALQSKEMNT